MTLCRKTLFIPTIAIWWCGCTGSAGSDLSVQGTRSLHRMVRVGMPIGDAIAALRNCGAKQIAFQIAPPEDWARQGKECEFYRLQSGRFLELCSVESDRGRLVESMFISSLSSESWSSKTDPRCVAFFNSFQAIASYQP
jgi:hypothetical protein